MGRTSAEKLKPGIMVREQGYEANVCNNKKKSIIIKIIFSKKFKILPSIKDRFYIIA